MFSKNHSQKNHCKSRSILYASLVGHDSFIGLRTHSNSSSLGIKKSGGKLLTMKIFLYTHALTIPTVRYAVSSSPLFLFDPLFPILSDPMRDSVSSSGGSDTDGIDGTTPTSSMAGDEDLMDYSNLMSDTTLEKNFKLAIDNYSKVCSRLNQYSVATSTIVIT